MGKRGHDNFGTDKVAKPTREMGESTQQSPALATLVRLTNGVEGQVHPLLSEYFLIGRDKTCHILIRDDSSVSRKHASITRSGVKFMLEDLGSSNGVFVNGTKLTAQYELMVGDKVEVGSQMFVFKRRV